MPEIIERIAKLFEAGEYPDKGISVTEADLDRLAEGFHEAPVKVEHQDTPFDGAIGVLKRIWRQGKDLMGYIGFSPQAWAFIDRAGARRLSIALAKDISEIREVSLVRSPRVAGAQVFDDRIELDGILSDVPTHDESEAAKMAMEVDSLQKENARLEMELHMKEVDTAIERFKRAGKVIPALEDIARAILIHGQAKTINFGGETLSPAELFSKYLNNMPALISFAEQAEARDNAESLSPEQIQLFKKLGLDPNTARQFV